MIKINSKQVFKKNKIAFYNQCSNDCKIIYQSFKIKTIIDKQTKQKTPITFIVKNNQNKLISNSYELDNQKKINRSLNFLIPKKDKNSFSKNEILKKEGKYFKFKPSTHPKVREEQIKIMNNFSDGNDKH